MYTGTHPMKNSPVGHGGQATLQHLEAATNLRGTSGCPAPGFLLGQLQPSRTPEAIGARNAARNAAGAVAEEGAFGTTTPEPSVMRSCWDGTWCWEMERKLVPNSEFPRSSTIDSIANFKPKVNRTQDDIQDQFSLCYMWKFGHPSESPHIMVDNRQLSVLWRCRTRHFSHPNNHNISHVNPKTMMTRVTPWPILDTPPKKKP